MKMVFNSSYCRILLRFLTLVTYTHSLANKCPCDVNTATRTADCSSRELKEVPECVPNTTERLNFSSNDLTYHPAQFKKLKHLVFLDLSNNRHFSPKTDSFQELEDLIILYLNGTNLEPLESKIFANLRNVKSLSLSNCGLRTLPETTFNQTINLQYLDLSSNFLEEIKNNQFSVLSNLRFLNLRRASLSTMMIISYNSFTGLFQLRYLSLEETKVTSYPPDVFKPLNSLEELHLQGSCATYTCDQLHECFKNISFLKKLYLDNFLVNHLGPGFSSLRNLEEIYFVGSVMVCNLSTLSNNTFENLQDTSISKISIEQCGINSDILPYAFSHLKSLTVLNMELIGIPRLCYVRHNFFETGLENTSILHLRFPLQCQLSYNRPYVMVLGGLTETPLQYLDMSHGSISGIEA